MIQTLLATAIIVSGWASQYAPGVMERVVVYRQAHGQLPADLPDVDGFIAVISCKELGQIYWLRPVGQEHWESFMVADCSGHQHATEWMLRNNIIGEVDWPTVERWDGKPRRGIRIERLMEDITMSQDQAKPTPPAKPQPNAEAMTAAQRFQRAFLSLAKEVIGGRAGKVHRTRRPSRD